MISHPPGRMGSGSSSGKSGTLRAVIPHRPALQQLCEEPLQAHWSVSVFMVCCWEYALCVFRECLDTSRNFLVYLKRGSVEFGSARRGAGTFSTHGLQHPARSLPLVCSGNGSGRNCVGKFHRLHLSSYTLSLCHLKLDYSSVKFV